MSLGGRWGATRYDGETCTNLPAPLWMSFSGSVYLKVKGHNTFYMRGSGVSDS